MDRLKARQEYIAVFIIAGIIASCFALIRHFSGIWAPIDSVDIAAYWSGVQLFLTDKNPYDSQIMILKQQELSSQRTDLMVWNPPILFAILSPFFSVSFYWARFIWTAVTAFANILGAYISWKVATVQSAIKFPGWLLFALFFCPYIYELSIEQISSFLNLFLVISIILFMRGHYAFAGAAAGLLIVKPHVVFLVYVWYFIISAIQKRWTFYIGVFSSIALFSIFAELLHPGINMEWITRESWPTQIVGSTLASLVRAAIFSYSKAYSQLPQIIIPLAAILAVAAAICRDYGRRNFNRSLVLAVLLCPLCSPYGFVFDQAILILPIMIIAAHALDQKSAKNKRNAILASLVVAQLLVILGAGVKVFGMILGWYLLPPLILIIWVALDYPTGKAFNNQPQSAT